MSVELRNLIRGIAADHPHDGPHELAKHVAAQTPPESLDGFYEEALAMVVAAFLGTQRRQALDGPTDSGPNKSAKLGQRRNWWKSVLSSRVPVEGGWKPLGECGVAELQQCVALREEHIAGMRAQIDNFYYLIELLGRHGVDTVADLPAQTSWRTK